MAVMRRTVKVIHFTSQLCGISPYVSFLRNGGIEKPVLCRKYLLCSLILIITISVIRLRYAIGLFRDSTHINSATERVNMQIILSLLACTLTTYLVSAITRLIGMRNFFKISRKLLSVGSFVNYREGTVFSNGVIALHVVLFVTYLIRYFFSWASRNCQLDVLHLFISGLVCDTVTSFAAVQFLYFVFTLRRHFMLLNSSLNAVVMSTVKSEGILSLKVHTVSDVLPERYSVISGVRDILYRHVMLCDIVELINSSSYSIQVLAFIGSKFVYATISLYLCFFFFRYSIVPYFQFVPLLSSYRLAVSKQCSLLHWCIVASLRFFR